MNVIVLMGRIASDVDLKYTPSGKAVVNFSLAVKRPFAKDTTDFLPCVAWEKQAEFISKHFYKGKMISINGYLTERRWEDSDGKKRYAYDVICDRCEFCGDKADHDDEPPNVNQFELIGDEPVPF